MDVSDNSAQEGAQNTQNTQDTQNIQSTQSVNDAAPTSSVGADEMAHVAQEIYKKNLELAETNKLLSLLRSVDEVIMGSVNDIGHIGPAIAQLSVETAGFVNLVIMLFDDAKRTLRPVRYTVNIAPLPNQGALEYMISRWSVPVDSKQNIVVRSIEQHQRVYSTSLAEVFDAVDKREYYDELQSVSKVRTIYSIPLTIRGVQLGAIVVFMQEDRSDISAFKKDVMMRLASVVGIALDNAMLYQQIEKANKKLKDLDRLKDDFVSVASHELRTPMTAIKSFLWMVINDKTITLPEKDMKYLTHAYTATNRLINLVNEMLNISRIESGRMDVIISKTDLLELVNDVVTEVKPRADELEITIRVVARELPSVLADADKIKEVLINLIGNSLKFTPRAGAITVDFDVSTTMVTTRVTDNGAGIDKDDQETLFQKFGFVGTSYKVNKSDAKGSGLGLYISKAIIDMHKGTMSAFSRGTGQGSTFSFGLRVYTDEGFVQFEQEQSNRTRSGLGVIHSSI